MSDQTVGSIVGFLRLNDSDWNQTLNRAEAKADELGRHSPNIKVTANVSDAVAKLSLVQAAERKVADATDRVTLAQAKLAAARNAAQGVPTEQQAIRITAAENALSKALRDQETALDRVGVARSKAARDLDDVDKKARTASGSIGLLGATVLALGPALVPLAAVGVGAFAGLTATAGVAALAVKGIENEMKAGTQVGKQYSAGMRTLRGELDTLEKTAAAGTLHGFNAALTAANGLFPDVNRDVGLFSQQLGDVAGHTMPALVSLFDAFEPLLSDIGADLVNGSAKLEQWAKSSDAVRSFVAYAQTELPDVEHTIGALATTVGHLVQGFAPLGSGTVQLLGTFSSAVNAIPVGVLQTLVPTVTSLALGFKALRTAQEASTALRAASEGAGLAAKALGGLGAGLSLASGPIGVAVTGVGLLATVLGHQKQAQQDATQAVNDYTSALRSDSGAIGDNTKLLVVQNLQKAGAITAAKQLGLSVADVTSAVLGNTDAQAKINALLDQYPNSTAQAIKASGLTADQYERNFTAADTLTRAIGANSKEVQASAAQYRDQQDALKANGSAVQALQEDLRKLPGYKTVTVVANTEQASSALDTVVRQFQYLNGTHSISVVASVEAVGAALYGGFNPGRAAGGPLLDGITPVGEAGLEFAVKRGSDVMIVPASKAATSPAMAAAKPMANNTADKFSGAGSDELVDEVVALRAAVDRLGDRFDKSLHDVQQRQELAADMRVKKRFH